MRGLDHPGYEYHPLSAERKTALSRAQRARIGNLPGHYRVYGVQVPEEHAVFIRERAADVARRRGPEAANAFVLQAKSREWRVRRGREWTDRQLAELRRRWQEGETGQRIAKAMGRSRSAVLGKVNRLGLRRTPKGFREVPVAMMRPMVAATLGLSAPNDQSAEFRTAMMLVAPMFVNMLADDISRWTGYPRGECAGVIQTMTTNGIWTTKKPVSDRYMQGGDEPGLQLGDVSLVLDTLLCLGQVRCAYGGEVWHSV